MQSLIDVLYYNKTIEKLRLVGIFILFFAGFKFFKYFFIKLIFPQHHYDLKNLKISTFQLIQVHFLLTINEPFFQKQHY